MAETDNKYDKIKYNNEFNKNNYDILATQELTGFLVSRINKLLRGYKLYGKYRFGNNILTKNISVLKKYNENNNIITKYKVIYQLTKRLPWIPKNLKNLIIAIKGRTIMPRIMTITIIKINDKNFCTINTHLDYKLEEIQKRQLNYLKKFIKKYSKKYQIILTGDFNMEINNIYFNEFIDYLGIYNIKRIPIDEKTNGLRHKNKMAIDHIFIPNDWIVINYGINENQMINNITDHKEIYVTAIIK